MNNAQIIYVVWVALIFWIRTPNPAMWVILANMVATLAACEAMDLGWLVRSPQYDDATMTEMLIDFVSLAVLLQWRGLSLIVAAGYALCIATYSLTVFFGVQITTTFAIVVGIGFVQLAVISIGSDGNNGGRRLRRLHGLCYTMASSRRYGQVHARGLAESRQVFSSDKRVRDDARGR